MNAAEKRNVEAYQMLLDLFKTAHIDNMKVLKALLASKEDPQPIYDGHNKRRVCTKNTSQFDQYSSSK